MIEVPDELIKVFRARVVPDDVRSRWDSVPAGIAAVLQAPEVWRALFGPGIRILLDGQGDVWVEMHPERWLCQGIAGNGVAQPIENIARSCGIERWL